MSQAGLIYITGAGHSGSSLLDLILGSHSQITGTGEVHGLAFNPTRQVCSCREYLPSCPYWTSVAKELAASQSLSPSRVWSDFPVNHYRAKAPHRRLPTGVEALLLLNAIPVLRMYAWFNHHARSHLKAAANSWILFDTLAKLDGVRFVLDSSKTPVRMKLLQHMRPRKTYVIHLVRDGRAVAASQRRRKGVEIEAGARSWFRSQCNAMLMMRVGLPRDRWLRVHYEDLAAHPERTLGEVCQFLDLRFEPEMLSFRAKAPHRILGNPMFKDPENRTVKLDERWRSELSTRDLEIFQNTNRGLVGRLNRHFGYR